VLENIYLIFLVWLLVNLLVYVIVGGVIIYVFENRNKRNVIKAMNDEDKEYLMRHYGIKDEKNLELPPSLLISLFLGGSGRAIKIVRSYLIEGPHTPNYNTYSGMIDRDDLFEFGMFVSDPNSKNRMMVGRSQRYYKYMLLYGFVIFMGYTVLWALIPYIHAVTHHFERINRYVYNFSEHDRIKLCKQGKKSVITTIETLQRSITINNR